MLTACSALSPAERPVIPTPPSATSAINFSELELVINPESSLAAGRDAEIVALLDAVSEQQLAAYVQTLQGFGTRNTFSDTQQADAGIGAARSWIHDEFLRINGGALQVTYDDFPATINGLTTGQRNIVATLPGIGDHLGAFVVMAHYDSRGVDPNDGNEPAPGANDNASGVALLLEMARLLSSRPWNQTIIFVAFAAEEQGTYGSRHFVQDEMLRGREFEAALDNDIVGGRPGIPQSVRVFSPGPDSSPSRRLAAYVQLIANLYLPDFPVEIIDGLDRAGRFSDHREFINAGMPGVRFTESVEDSNAQHGPGDTADKIDYGYLRRVTQLNLAALANMAGAPAPPLSPAVAAMSEPGAFVLTWAPDPLVSGYAVAFRQLGFQGIPPLRFVATTEAGNVAFTGLDPNVIYAVSLATVDGNGRISYFSPEVIVSSAPSQ